MDLTLWHGEDRSALVADGTVIEYVRPSHRYMSEGDYRTVATELATYGNHAAGQTVAYLAAHRGG